MSNFDTDDLIREYEERDVSEDEDKGVEDRANSRLAELSDSEAEGGTGNKDDEAQEDTKKKDKDKDDKPKKPRTIITLSVERLKDKNKGVHKIESYFEGFKFRGKGHEKEDLDRVMKRLEHWCHRMFPKYAFDDCLEKIEQIGLKRQMSAFVEKYRRDMLTEDLVTQDDDNLVDETEERAVADNNFDSPFDDLLKEHTEIRRQISQKGSEDVPKPAESTLSDEVREMIERKKQMALEKRRAKMAEKQREESAIGEAMEMNEAEKTGDEQSNSNVASTSAMSLQEQIEMKRQMALARKLQKQKEREQAEMQKSQVVVEPEGDFPTEQELDAEMEM